MEGNNGELGPFEAQGRGRGWRERGVHPRISLLAVGEIMPSQANTKNPAERTKRNMPREARPALYSTRIPPSKP